MIQGLDVMIKPSPSGMLFIKEGHGLRNLGGRHQIWKKSIPNFDYNNKIN